MKKIICLLLAVLIMMFPCTGVFAQEEVVVVLDGVILEFDQNPVIIDGRTLVPLRGIFEPMGATVEWDDATQTVTAVKDDITVKLTIGDNILYKNGTPITLDVPAQLIGSRTMVPARAVSEAFDAKVGWIESAWAVTIVTDELLKETINTLENADELALNFKFNLANNEVETEIFADIGQNKAEGIEYLQMAGYYLPSEYTEADEWTVMVSDKARSYADLSGETELKNEPTDIIPDGAIELILTGFNLSALIYEDEDVAIYSDGSDAVILIDKAAKDIILEMPGNALGIDGLTDDIVYMAIVPDSGTAVELQNNYLK